MSQKKQPRRYRNQQLVGTARRGLAAQDLLLMCEEGFRTFVPFLLTLRGAVRDPEIGLRPIDVRRCEEDTKVLLSLAEADLARLRSLVAQDDAFRCHVEARMGGFRRAEEKVAALRGLLGRGGGLSTLEGAVAEGRRELQEIIAEGLEARETLLTENELMIKDVVWKISKGRPELAEDLTGIALEAFSVCVDRTYELHRGIEFSTYVYNCMWGRCNEEAAIHDHTIHIPQDLLGERRRAARGGEVDPGREESFRMVDQAGNLISLNAPTRRPDGEATEIGELVGDCGLGDIEGRIALNDAVARVLAAMRPRHRRVLELRFGLGGGEELVLEEVAGVLHAEENEPKTPGEKLGENEIPHGRPLTKERIRQIEKAAMNEFRGLMVDAFGGRVFEEIMGEGFEG